MMNRLQERALRTLCRKGGRLDLPTLSGTVTICIEIKVRANYPDKANALLLECPQNTWLTLHDWSPRELYEELAERLDDEHEIVTHADTLEVTA
ncbi:hypothetical protein [Vreelandella titanicae]|uniref:hypothetical protein n=1 Tax=Vreelandella titanicae TaxID=664683 RepID=UPI0039BFB84E